MINRILICLLFASAAFAQEHPSPRRGPEIPVFFGLNMEEVTCSTTVELFYPRFRYAYMHGTKTGCEDHNHLAVDAGIPFTTQQKCSAVDQQSLKLGPFFEDEHADGFTVRAAAGHTIVITCRAIIATGPLFERGGWGSDRTAKTAPIDRVPTNTRDILAHGCPIGYTVEGTADAAHPERDTLHCKKANP